MMLSACIWCLHSKQFDVRCSGRYSKRMIQYKQNRKLLCIYVPVTRGDGLFKARTQNSPEAMTAQRDVDFVQEVKSNRAARRALACHGAISLSLSPSLPSPFYSHYHNSSFSFLCPSVRWPFYEGLKIK